MTTSLKELLQEKLKVCEDANDEPCFSKLEVQPLLECCIEMLETLQAVERFSINCKRDHPVLGYTQDLARDTIAKVERRMMGGLE